MHFISRRIIFSESMRSLKLLCVLISSLTLIHGHDIDMFEHIPIERIEGTELYTGIFYKITLKGRNQSFLAIDDFPKDRKGETLTTLRYIPEERSRFSNDTDWMFLHIDSSSLYYLVNRANATSHAFRYLIEADSLIGYRSSWKDHEISVSKLMEDEEVMKQNNLNYTRFLWKPERASDGFYKITDNNYWHITLKNNDNNLEIIKNLEASSQFEFEFKPSGFEIEAEISNFEFTFPDTDILEENLSKNRPLVFSEKIESHGSADMEATISKTISVNEKFTFGFKEEIKGTFKTTVKASFFKLAETEIETGIEISAEGHQEWGTEKVTSHTFQGVVKVPKNSSVVASGYVEMLENVVFPFTAVMKFKASRRRRTKAELQKEVTLDGKLVREELIRRKYKYPVFKTTKDEAWVRLSGNITGSYAFRIVMESHDIHPSPPAPPAAPGSAKSEQGNEKSQSQSQDRKSSFLQMAKTGIHNYHSG